MIWYLGPRGPHEAQSGLAHLRIQAHAFRGSHGDRVTRRSGLEPQERPPRIKPSERGDPSTLAGASPPLRSPPLPPCRSSRRTWRMRATSRLCSSWPAAGPRPGRATSWTSRAACSVPEQSQGAAACRETAASELCRRPLARSPALAEGHPSWEGGVEGC